MPFTALELQNLANTTLDHHLRKQPVSQTIQDKPLLKALLEKKKTFGAGKENITGPVKGEYSSSLQGYSHNDQVGYVNPANIKRWAFPWKELHLGIEVTMTELKKNGISVTDTTSGNNTSTHSDRELVALTNILEDKYEDMDEGYERSLNAMLWNDGVQDSKEIPGVTSIIGTAPTTGVVGGLDRSVLTWWQNRVVLGIDASTPANQNLINTLTINDAHTLGGYPQTDIALLALHPETMPMQIGHEAATRLVVRVRDVVTCDRPLAGHLTDLGHD